MTPVLLSALLVSCAVHATPSNSLEISEISESGLKPVTDKFDELVKDGAPEIYFRLNSFGGSIFDGMDFIQHVEDAKKRHPGLRTTCAVDTKAMSMAFVILQSPACDTRLMTKRSVLLAHNGSAGIRGNAKELDNASEFLKAVDEAMAAIASSRLTISPSEYHARTDGQDWSMSAKDAKKVGAVDGFIDPKDIPVPFILAPAMTDIFSL